MHLMHHPLAVGLLLENVLGLRSSRSLVNANHGALCTQTGRTQYVALRNTSARSLVYCLEQA